MVAAATRKRGGGNRLKNLKKKVALAGFVAASWPKSRSDGLLGGRATLRWPPLEVTAPWMTAGADKKDKDGSRQLWLEKTSPPTALMTRSNPVGGGVGPLGGDPS